MAKKKHSDKDVRKIAASVLKDKGRETWTVRTPDGHIERISTSP
jgi:hypothetical protein